MKLLAGIAFLKLDWKAVRLSPAAALTLLVTLGMLLRLVHFLRCPGVWHDEAAVMLNAIHLDFPQMVGPLSHHEAAPPLFLMAERALFLGLGDAAPTFRLLPFAASCLSLLLLARLARRLLPPTAALWAVALFATSDRLIFHAIEAKPYSLDVLVAVGIAYGYVRTRRWPLWQQCLAAWPLLPLVLWLSFPACFVIGGWFAAQLPDLMRSRSWRDWLAASVLGLAVAVSFLALVLGPVRAQHDAAMESCWTAGFPDWQRPWLVPVWLVRSTLDIGNYCLSPQGWMLAGALVTGALYFWRENSRRLLGVLLFPQVLALVASLLGKYPYCGLRVLAFMTPAICLLTAAGLRPLTPWLRERAPVLVWFVWIGLTIPFVHSALRVAFPWPRADTEGSARHVLVHWQPGDCVDFNHWEGEYYLRHLAASWFQSAQPDSSAAQRLWYVAVATDRQQRDALLQAVAPGWRLTERCEFNDATVALFVRDYGGPVSTSASGVVP